jgi:hypothetical protein
MATPPIAPTTAPIIVPEGVADGDPLVGVGTLTVAVVRGSVTEEVVMLLPLVTVEVLLVVLLKLEEETVLGVDLDLVGSGGVVAGTIIEVKARLLEMILSMVPFQVRSVTK